MLDNTTETWVYEQKDPNELYLNSDPRLQTSQPKSQRLEWKRCGTCLTALQIKHKSLCHGENAGICCIVKKVARSRQTSQPLEQVDMEVEVTTASDRSPARSMCARTSSGEMRLFSVFELLVPEAFCHKESVLMSAGILLDWTDTGMEADTTERLRLLAHEMTIVVLTATAKLAAMLTHNLLMGTLHSGLGRLFSAPNLSPSPTRDCPAFSDFHSAFFIRTSHT